MAHRTRRAMGLLAIAGLAALSAWLWRSEEPPPPPAAGSPSPAATSAPVAAPAATTEMRPQRDAAVLAASADPLAAGPSAGVLAPGGTTATIRGRCLAAENGQPLAGCEVRVGAAAPHVVHAAADGTFAATFDLGKHSSVSVRVTAPLRVPREGTLENLRDGATEDLGDILLPRGFVVSGRVVDADGAGVTGNNVVVFGVDTALRAGQHGQGTASAACATDGTFTLDFPLPPGAFRAQVFGPRRQRGDGAFRVDATAGVAPLELVVEPQNEITGVVVDDLGQPMMDVGLMTEHGGAMDESGPNGAFRLAPRQAVSGPTRVLLRDPGSWSSSFVAPTVDWGQRDVRLVLPRGPAVAIEAVDDRGAAVTEFGVLFVPVGRTGLNVSRDHGSHPEGRLVVPTTRLGRHVLRVLPKAPDLLASEPQFVEVAGPSMPVLRVPLARLQSVHVDVVGADGAGIGRADVRLVHIGDRLDHAHRGGQDPREHLVWNPGSRNPELVSAAQSAADGRAALLAPTATHGLLLRVSAEGHEPAFVQDPPLRPHAPLRVVLARGGALTGRVALHRQSRDLFQVELRRIQAGTVALDWQRLQVQLDGAFAAPLLPVGDYALTVLRQMQAREPGSTVASFAPFGAGTARVRIVAGETANVELDAPVVAMGSLRGRVVGVDAADTRHAVLLSLLGTENAQRGLFELGADGSFVADGLPPGRYQLAVSAGNPFGAMPALLAPEFDIAPGGAHVQDFVFTRRKLTLRLRTPSDEPVQGVVELRCGSLRRRLGNRSDLVLDPAPEVPVQVRCEGAEAWSLPVSMPQDRSEHAVLVVLPAPPR